MIHYIKGDATRPIGEGRKVLAHIVNTRGGWGKGFVLAVSKRWREPEMAYRDWYADRHGETETPFELGQIQIVPVEDDIYVANMVAQEGYGPRNDQRHRTAPGGPAPIRYPALEECLGSVADDARVLGATVHMPRIGTGLAGGDWKVIGPMVEKAFEGLEVFVYELDGK